VSRKTNYVEMASRSGTTLINVKLCVNVVTCYNQQEASLIIDEDTASHNVS